MTSDLFDHSKLYKIVNEQYPKFAADLIHANRLGPVSGYEKNHGSNNQTWRITAEGDKVAIENVAAPGIHAGTYVIADSIGISGIAKASIWKLEKVKSDVYRIATPDGQFVWSLDEGSDYFTILLRPVASNPGKKAEWKFEDTK